MSRDKPTISILRKVVIDVFLIAGAGLCLFLIKLLWTPYKRGFFCGDESLMLPYRDDTITVLVLRVYGIGLPLLAMIICEWTLLRRERDETRVFGIRIPVWVRGLYCVVVSAGLGVCFVELTTEVAKNTIGRLRPHFFLICQPSINCSLAEWRERYIQPDQYYCRGTMEDKFRNMRMSFPSGHSSWAAFTMLYFALYLERRMVWRGTRLVRHTLQFAAMLLSWYTAVSRVSDFKHHWSDVLAGYCLGLVFAIVMWTWGTDLVQPKTEQHKHSVVPQHDVIVIGQEQIGIVNEARRPRRSEAEAASDSRTSAL